MPNMLQLFKHGWNLDDHRPEFKVRVSMLLIEGLADSRTEDASVSNITLTPDEGCDQRVCPLVRFAGSHKAGSTQHLGIFRVGCQKVRQFESQCGIWLGAQNYQFGATLETARGRSGRGIIPKSFRLVCLSLPPIEIVGPSGHKTGGFHGRSITAIHEGTCHVFMGTLGKADQLPSVPFTKWDRGMFGEIDRHRESALAGERQARAEQVLMQNKRAS